MLKLFTCVGGHAWEAAGDGDALPACPACGAPPDLGPLFQPEPGEPSPAAEPPADPAALTDAAGLPVVAGYDNLDSLGRNAAGVRLYRARQKVIGRPVLLQVVLAREDAGQRAWNHLRGEASAHGKLSHPNVVAIHEVGERDRQLFFNAMAYIDGPSLAEAVGETPLPLRQVAPLMELLAGAIAHASARGVLHRHLEPAVVLLQAATGPGGAACQLHERYYVPQIAGFGLARRPTEGDAIDADLYAEPGYLSPEQAWGRGRDLGPPTDVYGLGGILYFLLAGRPPFRGPTLADIIDAIETAPLVAPPTRRAPADMQFICKKALARQPARRYPEAGAMADDFRRAANLLPLPSRNLSILQRFGLWCRRRPAAAALLVVAILGALGTAIGFASGPPDGPLSPARQEGVLRDLADARAQAQALRRQLTAWRLFDDYRAALARAARLPAPEAAEVLPTCEASLRGVEWHYLDRRRRKLGPVELPGTAGAVALAVGPRLGDGMGMATAAPDGKGGFEVKQWTVSSRAVEGLASRFDSPVRGMVYNRSGDRLAVFGGGKEGWLHGSTTHPLDLPGRPKLTYATRAAITSAAFNPDNERLVVGTARGTLQFLDADLDEDGDLIDTQSGRPVHVAYRQNGRAIAYFTAGGRTVRYCSDPPDGSLPEVAAEAAVECITFNPAGDLFIGCADGSVWRSWGGVGEKRWLLDLPAAVKRMACSGDGERLALACADGTVRVVGRAGTLTDPLRYGPEVESPWHEMLSIPVSGVAGLAFGPNDRCLAAAGPGGVVVLGSVGNDP